ncbi:HIV Tat-specific factor 1 [Pygocentrus nattereri]|uniref:17S U2 SnRNP complex component HTATSF1 n=1 Tax=Pygocentrus nattereri TaxID=42514 RepID=A0A3B4EL12_PYGNA|nr:HIV Tat-specific factor 1 [Pygocentrus nattereri]XP_017581206.1 HIV Tat-specific factor 1 [Pygocentrus nattereri]XP_017581207.1 HIV Tat-specific factor 1 [Pygocentrus nattereri]
MSGDSDRNKEFLEQLRLQELYGQKREDGDDPYTYVDPEDGTVYDWDHDKKAWFPKITEDFIAAYQANYGFSEDGTPDPTAAAPPGETPPDKPKEEKKLEEEEKKLEEEEKKEKEEEEEEEEEKKPDSSSTKEVKQKGEKRKAEPGWFDIEEDKNTNVYVSGLPPDITPDEFVEFMSKCGIIMRDPITEEYKVKLYKDSEGNQKGDGLCCYLKRESVALAERLLDDSEIRGYRLHVEAARFELKGQYDASKKKKKNKEYRKKLQQQQKQLDWRPEKTGEARKRHERVVIIQNMFHPKDFEEDPLVLNEYREDLRTECEKFGEVKKVIIFDRHPDGVASVAFKEPEGADVCQVTLDGRWFGGRKLSAQLWDGVTDYQVEETSREREERLKGWSTFLGDEKAAEAAGQAKDTEGMKEAENSQGAESASAPPTDTAPSQSEDETAAEQPDEADVDSTDSSLAGSDDEA